MIQATLRLYAARDFILTLTHEAALTDTLDALREIQNGLGDVQHGLGLGQHGKSDIVKAAILNTGSRRNSHSIRL